MRNIGLAVVFGFLAGVLVMFEIQDNRTVFKSATDSDGNVLAVREIDSHGDLHGVETVFYTDGSLRGVFRYQHGAVIGFTTYWPSGRLQTVASEGDGFSITREDFPDHD